ncbi:MAG TPA: phosphoglucosamine mutase [Candidatus Limnocylindria bacterium]|nr:phosphoglucosamine mutase [Candidatus Limnocylindria bacterium]
MSGERRLFGTDGVRGTANVEPMTSETALRLGRALAHVSKRSPHRHKILIGKDTRLSGYMLEQAMASGICSMGVDVLLVGPLPTPGIAFLTRSMRADAGVVISASHNPFQDNGIKFFGSSGFKLADELELEIERYVFGDAIDALRPTATEIGKAFRIDDAVGRYNVLVKSTFPRAFTLDGLTIALDCGHGAAYRVAPEVLEELGARVVAIGVDPNGENINDGVGALHPAALQALVRESGAHVGLALDGDADRAILVDEQGAVVDGDEVMAILATHLHGRGELQHGTLVTTVMSNLGLHVAMRERGIQVVTTAVGDRYVVEAMVRGGYNLGGEQSGHIVFLDHNTTGDGLITGLAVLARMVESGRPLSELRRVMTRYPQVLRNLRVREKPPVDSLPGVARAVREAERVLGERGRVLVRYSGTETLLRVMVEGESEAQIAKLAADIVAAADAAIGG